MEKKAKENSETYIDGLENILVQTRDFIFRYLSTLGFFLRSIPWSQSEIKARMEEKRMLKPMTFLLVNAFLAIGFTKQFNSNFDNVANWSDLVPKEVLLNQPAGLVYLVPVYLLVAWFAKLTTRWLIAKGNEHFDLIESIVGYSTGFQYGLCFLVSIPTFLIDVLVGWHKADSLLIGITIIVSICLAAAVLPGPIWMLSSCLRQLQPNESPFKFAGKFLVIVCFHISTMVVLFLGGHAADWLNPEALLNGRHTPLNCLIDQVVREDTTNTPPILHFVAAVENNAHVPLLIPKRSIRVQIAKSSMKDTCLLAPLLTPTNMQAADDQNPYLNLQNGDEIWVRFDLPVSGDVYYTNTAAEFRKFGTPLYTNSSYTGESELWVEFSMDSVVDGMATRKRSSPVETHILKV